MTPFTDLVRLALLNGGRIPATIPAHYVRWAYALHVSLRGRSSAAALNPAPSVIRL